MSDEAAVLKRVLLALSHAGTTIFRQNVGQVWAGKFLLRAASHQRVGLQPGDVVIRAARPFHAGLCEGSSDCIGWTPVVITQQMVGTTIAVFTAVEVKDEGAATRGQVNFISQVKASGGFAGIARSAEDALRLIGRGE